MAREIFSCPHLHQFHPIPSHPIVTDSCTSSLTQTRYYTILQFIHSLLVCDTDIIGLWRLALVIAHCHHFILGRLAHLRLVTLAQQTACFFHRPSAATPSPQAKPLVIRCVEPFPQLSHFLTKRYTTLISFSHSGPANFPVNDLLSLSRPNLSTNSQQSVRPLIPPLEVNILVRPTLSQ